MTNRTPSSAQEQVPTTAALPSGWEECVSPNGRLYFTDHNTRSTTFIDPRTGTPTTRRVKVDAALSRKRASSLAVDVFADFERKPKRIKQERHSSPEPTVVSKHHPVSPTGSPLGRPSLQMPIQVAFARSCRSWTFTWQLSDTTSAS